MKVTAFLIKYGEIAIKVDQTIEALKELVPMLRRFVRK